MKARDFAVLGVAAALGACAYTSSSPFASYVELPPPSVRGTVGLWDLGDDNCRGSIQTAAGSSYWVIDCRMKAGHGHCTHGLPLARQGPRLYATEDGRITFALQEDGGLEETNRGRLYRRYGGLDGAICGAAARAARTD